MKNIQQKIYISWALHEETVAKKICKNVLRKNASGLVKATPETGVEYSECWKTPWQMCVHRLVIQPLPLELASEKKVHNAAYGKAKATQKSWTIIVVHESLRG